MDTPAAAAEAGKIGAEQLTTNQMVRKNRLHWLRFFGPVRDLSETFRLP